MVTAQRWTIADLDMLPETWEDRRYEIIDGELSMSTQPDWRHQLVAVDICDALNRWSRHAHIGLAIFAPGVIFSRENAVAPDVVWVRRERFRAVLQRDGKLHSAPDLMVEILSPGTKNIRRDREAKLALYSRWGVLEYWIVDWPARRIEVYRRREAQLHLAETLYADDTLRSPNLPGFSTMVGELFAQIPEDIGEASPLDGEDEDA
ncbi:MAG: Uma2 family endonuclease [Chloroflexota bacterium]